MTNDLFAEIIRRSGEDANREGLAKTPERAEAALFFPARGYPHDVEKLVYGAIFASQSDEKIVVDNIEFYSLCEHHILPILGQ